jgi:prepilin-type N-terminal cleavage/methylation domain-containing protein
MKQTQLPFHRNTGFTLIEVIIVMAITGLILVIAFIGQRQLVARARFDSSVNKLVQNITYARNFATSNVNTEGAGNKTDAVVAGIGFELDNSHPGGNLAELEPVYCNPTDCANTYSDLPNNDASRCPHLSADNECFEQFFGPTDLTLSGNTTFELIYLNTTRGVKVCQPIIDSNFGTIKDACATSPTGPITVTVTDPNGFTADIQFDLSSGTPKRMN